jgi:Protein of unknown function (DUF1236)
MKKSASVAVAAVLLMSGVSVASAASHMSNGSGKSAAASDRLELSSAQQKSIWNDISRHAAKQNAPSNFNAAVGTAIPAGVSTYPLPRRAARDVPVAKPYRYAMLQDRLLIVNPSDKKIADVVTK